LDLIGFYAQRFGKIGLTLLGSRNASAAYDPAKIGLTAIPKVRRYTINPRLFLFGKRSELNIGMSYVTEDRLGGSVSYIRNGTPEYFEQNNTDRVTVQAGWDYKLDQRNRIQLKNSFTRFDRDIRIPTYRFQAAQQSSYSELNWSNTGKKSQWVGGFNLLTDKLSQALGSPTPLNYQFITCGVFVQNTFTVSQKWTIESGLRADYVKEFGWELLPRVSLLFKPNESITSRFGGGYGYKTPTVFTEETERSHYSGVLPIQTFSIQNERSRGLNWDINYKAHIGGLGLTLNQMFFYTRLNNPLVLGPTTSGVGAFINAKGHLDTRGMETNLRFTYRDFKLFVGYTYTGANTHYNGITQVLPLTPKHRLNNVLFYEVEDKWKLGLEAYYFSRQQLNDGQRGKSYWIAGFMAERIWEKFSLFVNFENFPDTRQTRFDTIFNGTRENPVFRDIYAPVEGFVVNGGLKLKL
jgi:iron complex outermembrane receptor protein